LNALLFVVAVVAAALLVNTIQPFLMLRFSLVEAYITTRMPSHFVTAVSSHLELSWV
jgi:hypothetical protein